MAGFLDVEPLVRALDRSVERWHAGPIVHDEPAPPLLKASLIHGHNFELWHQEDEARAVGVDDAVIGQVKRRIDPLNQNRNDAIEALDELLLEELAARNVVAGAGARLHSETVGSIVDKLSILTLKIYHMREETLREDAEQAHREQCRGRLAILGEQRSDLAGALAELLDDLFAGHKRFKVYRQMKMYNDPSLNPVLYGRPAEC